MLLTELTFGLFNREPDVQETPSHSWLWGDKRRSFRALRVCKSILVGGPQSWVGISSRAISKRHKSGEAPNKPRVIQFLGLYPDRGFLPISLDNCHQSPNL